MKLPSCDVPTRTQWTKLRDNSGGKKGLTKVSMGDALDEFHAKLKKAEKAEKPEDLEKPIEELTKVATSYLNEIKKAKKYSDLESTVSQKILGNLRGFTEALEKQAEEAKEKVRNTFSQRISLGEKSIEQLLSVVVPLNEEFQELSDKYKIGVPEKEKEDLVNKLKTGAKQLEEAAKSKEQVSAGILSLSKEKSDHPGIIEEFDSDLKKLGTNIKTLTDAIRFGKGKIQELAIYLKG